MREDGGWVGEWENAKGVKGKGKGEGRKGKVNENPYLLVRRSLLVCSMQSGVS